MPTYEEWVARIKELKAKETLTKEEADELDFMEQKLDDWATD